MKVTVKANLFTKWDMDIKAIHVLIGYLMKLNAKVA